MALLQLWKNNPETIDGFAISQIVSASGDGKLRDGSICSNELREYLAEAPTSSLVSYISQCLEKGFTDSGMVLQDLVNEVGKRLDYSVEHGRYQGVKGEIGYDGIWRSDDTIDLVIEVKTTDSYRISLDTVANYRSRLIEEGKLDEQSAILIVVGRNDTGEFEAQIRGSRHAWDMRVISADALVKLLQVKENSNDEATGLQIRSLFAPVEYTRLDKMVDIVFTAATDIELSPEELEAASSPSKDSSRRTEHSTYQFTDSAVLHAKRLKLIEAFGNRHGKHLLQKTRAKFSSQDKSLRVVCSISKRYNSTSNPYWYAFHPQWKSFLEEADEGYFMLGCMDRNDAFAIPIGELEGLLPKLNQTVRETGAYWHVHLVDQSGQVAINIPNESELFDLTKFGFMSS